MRKMKKNIAMIAFAHYPNDTRVRREAEALVDSGNSVDVFCLLDKREAQAEITNGVNTFRIKLNKTPKGKLGYLYEYAMFITRVFIKLSLLHLKNHYHIIHVHNVPDILVLSSLVPKIMGAKIILDMHEIMPEFFMKKYQVSEAHLVIKFLKFLEKFSAKFTNHIIVASPFWLEVVTGRSSVPEKCTTILNLPDTKYFNSIEKKNYEINGKFKIIYPGTLSEQHGVDIAIRAISLVLSETNIPIEFHIYGRGPEKENLISLAKELNIDNYVFFHRDYRIEKYVNILKTMDLGIVPKRNGVFIGEAMSTKLFEFAAIGLPTVVSLTSGDSLYFDDSMVVFFEPANESELAENIIKLYQDPQTRETLGQNAKMLSKKLNWDYSKQQLIEVYNNII
jgi:glycosyltransferase involved in cell wall biosynthesis